MKPRLEKLLKAQAEVVAAARNAVNDPAPATERRLVAAVRALEKIPSK